MSSTEEKPNPGSLTSEADNLVEGMKLLKEIHSQNGVRKSLNCELWHACAGPLVALPQVGSLVYYFPQGHSEQVAVSTNKAATAQVPNYPNLPSQLLCHVHNVTLHADKDTDEIYAQMSLQPVGSDRDVFSVPDFGLKPSKHPTEFFCKTLTASDTSTHGGFSVPRRAAEKLFPQLDYSMQPPSQELRVRDLHDNTWTFRHIYRGQPKRHLLTTGWSMFVGAKRLRAGDAVLFVRDERSQLMLGVRRVSRQQTTLPSSVLSADSMHIGIFAAAAHAAASRSSFTIFYNPRACPSEFVIPLAKYRKAVYSMQHSVGMRFGMMFETEESSKRRYMGTIVGISDMDPLRWPNSKWRSLLVEWDEPGCGDKQTRVSPWEVETPESLFIFPSLTGTLKRPFNSSFLGSQLEWGNAMINRPLLRVPETAHGELQHPSVSNLWSEQLMKMLTKPQGVVAPINAAPMQETMVKDSVLQEAKSLMQQAIKKPEIVVSLENIPPQAGSHPQIMSSQSTVADSSVLVSSACSELSKLESLSPGNQSNQFQTQSHFNEDKLLVKPMNSHGLMNDFDPTNLNHGTLPCHSSLGVTRSRDLHVLQNHQTEPVHFMEPASSATSYLQCPSQVEFHPVSQTGFPSGGFWNLGSLPVTHSTEEFWNPCFNSSKTVPQPEVPVLLAHQDMPNLEYSSCCLKDLSDENHKQSEIYSCLNLDGSNSGSTVIDHSVSSAVLDDFGALKNTAFQNPSDYLVGNFCSNQDIQSQITPTSLEDSKKLSSQEYADNSGGASSSNVDFDDNSILQHSSWQQVTPRIRTYTKIQKAGSVGRSIDVSSFKNYEELRSEIESMFNLKDLLNDTASGWKLVYVDFENDVLLVGDDPWEEFVGCVKCIRILSPLEVQQMGEEGMQLLNSAGIQAVIGCDKDGSNGAN